MNTIATAPAHTPAFPGVPFEQVRLRTCLSDYGTDYGTDDEKKQHVAIMAMNPDDVDYSGSGPGRIIADLEQFPDAERYADLFAASPDLLKIARQYSADCDTRISLLNDEIISGDDPDIDELEAQIVHWTATKNQIDTIITKATRTDHGQAA